jgi:hypothetical protein
MCDKETLFIQIRFIVCDKETLFIQIRFTMYDKETLLKPMKTNTLAFLIGETDDSKWYVLCYR